MGKKIFLLLILICSSIGGYGLVFGSSLVFGVEISYVGTVSEKIFLDDENLSKTIVSYRSNTNISDYEIYSSCESSTQFLEKYKGVYFFEIDFHGNTECKNEYIILKNPETQEKIVNSMSELEFIPANQELATFIDYSDQDLELYESGLEIDMNKNSLYKNSVNLRNIVENYNYIFGNRVYQEAEYQKNIIEEIQTGRQEKYLIPVAGRSLSYSHSKIPNAPRNYRESYTDGIHHGWDIDGDFGEELIALDDGIIVRVVSDFDRTDFDKIDYGNNLSEYQKTRNLDILRGKQVWLKTLKGEVVFYSHLNDVAGGIEEGVRVNRGDVLGTMGVTGVPGDNYTDYHLHFPIMENPYRIEDAGRYDFGDYMVWNWKLHDLPAHEVLEQQSDIFITSP
ncbi:M23 family metallopeptidase [Candidatus Gracilibacteria bacterium]|nr:M23 family metallopeptidase [Candidatus Gracilibacteria bacterium]